MIVITLTDCPPSLRGDLTKWLQEINTGVYVGRVSARVREEIWKRLCENARTGRATMVFSANNEQHMDFRVYNNDWEPIDFDGLKLMLRPSHARLQKKYELRRGFSKAAKNHMARRTRNRRNSDKSYPEAYIVLDVETTGLSITDHEIIEIGAILVRKKKIESQFHALIKNEAKIPPCIETLTGISNELLALEGRELSEVLPEFLSFAGVLPVVSHNANFDYLFLRKACERYGLPLFSNRCIDTLAMSRRLIDDAPNYKLETLVNYFGFKAEGKHRSLQDCLSVMRLYEKLIEMNRETK